mgnify:FL=1
MGLKFMNTTTGLTFLLLMVGIYTKEVGADLTCGMNWPLCDGAVYGVFPANIPSAIEWSHRFLAFIVGILILFAVYRAWKIYGKDSRITKSIIFSALLLPIQVGLGAVTVMKVRLFPGGNRILIEPLISVAHNAVGVLILVALVSATLWEWDKKKIS